MTTNVGYDDKKEKEIGDYTLKEVAHICIDKESCSECKFLALCKDSRKSFSEQFINLKDDQ